MDDILKRVAYLEAHIPCVEVQLMARELQGLHTWESEQSVSAKEIRAELVAFRKEVAQELAIFRREIATELAVSKAERSSQISTLISENTASHAAIIATVAGNHLTLITKVSERDRDNFKLMIGIGASVVISLLGILARFIQ